MAEGGTKGVTFKDIGENEAGQRLDNFLIKELKGVPKSRIYRLLRKGEVRVNKGRAKPDRHLLAGDRVRIPPIRMGEEKAVPAASSTLRKILRENILFDDDALLVINKPSGLAVHGGSGLSLGLIEALRSDLGPNSFLELVHRLDRETSGCILLARSRAALVDLHEQIRQGALLKRYLLLVAGKWPKGLVEINAPLLKNQMRSGERMVKVESTGKDARTNFDIKERFSIATLMQATLDTGRTHQIRVHCRHVDHPVAGDQKYGDTGFNQTMMVHGLKRLFLHASEVGFRHPISKEWIEVEAPLPDSLANILPALR